MSAAGRKPARSWPSGWFGVVTWMLGGLLLAFVVLPIARLATTSSPTSAPGLKAQPPAAR